MIVAIHKPNYLYIRNSYIWRLEKYGLEAATEELLAELGEDFIKELYEISFEEALSAYEKMREKEWKRLYTNVEDGLIVVKQMVTINEKLKIQLFLYNPFLNFNLEEWSKNNVCTHSG